MRSLFRKAAQKLLHTHDVSARVKLYHIPFLKFLPSFLQKAREFRAVGVKEEKPSPDMNPKVWTKLNIKLFERMSSVLNRAHSF